MTDETFQDDFFGEEFGEKKARKSRLLELYSKQRFLPHLRIPTEYSVIIAISILVLILLSYAVGVERGKRLMPKKDIAAIKEIEKKIEEKIEYVERPLIAETKEEFTDIKPEPEKVAKKEEKEKSAYIIQLASFAKEDMAKRELEKLKKKALNAKMEKKGKWYQVYAGGYNGINEAKKAQQVFVKDYKDCFIVKKGAK